MKKICIIMNDDHEIICGGVARFVMEIAPRLSRYYQVTVIVTRSKSGIQTQVVNENFQIVQSPAFFVPYTDICIPAVSRAMKKYIQENDFIFIQTLEHLYPLFLTLRLKKKLILYFHCLDWEILPRTLGFGKMGFLLVGAIRAFWAYWNRRAHHICLPSPSFSVHLKDAKVKTPFSWVPAGVDLERFVPADEKRKKEMKQRLGLDPAHPVIGFVGRFWPDKNLGFLLKVFSSAYQKNSSLRLLLVGKGYPQYERMVSEFPGVLWVGQQNDVVPYLQAMDVYCHPIAPTETSSLATMEAMACGLPVVVNAVAYPKEYIKNEENGFLIDPPDDLDQFTRRLNALLENAQLRKQIGEKARETIVSQFSWDRTASILKKIFDETGEGSERC